MVNGENPYLLRKIGNFLIHPFKAFEEEENTSIARACKYLFLLLLIESFAGVIYANLITGDPLSLPDIYLVVPLSYILHLVHISILGGIVSIFSLVITHRGLLKSFKAVFYGATPFLLFGGGWYTPPVWIPALLWKWTVILWSWILTTIGIKKLHEVSSFYRIGFLFLSVLIAYRVTSLIAPVVTQPILDSFCPPGISCFILT